MREKVGKSRNTLFFQWFVAPEGRKVGSLKQRVRSQLARWEAHLQVKMYKTPQLRTTFGSCDVEKVHAVVVRSTFPSQNVQNTPLSDHFWKLRCRKSARRCGAKHISKSNVQNTPASDHFWKLRCRKTPHVRATFGGSDLEKVHAVAAGSTFRSQNVQNTRGSDHFWRFRCRFASLRVITLLYTLHYTTVHYTTLHSTTLQLQLQNYSELHNYTPLHSTTLHYVI